MEQIGVSPKSYDAQFPSFACPTPIGEYTINEERKIEIGRAKARYLYSRLIDEKGLRLDLSDGFATFQPKDSDQKLNALLAWICTQSPSGGRLKQCLHETDFVCWRGLLTKISATPFSQNDDWSFIARKAKGVIFLLEQETEAQALRKAKMSPRDHLMTYWGFKFEQYTSTRDIDGVPSTSEPVTQNEEFGVVVKTKLSTPNGPIRLVYSGEVDCIDENGDLVELKTQRQALEGGFWRQKSMKWWLQSFLLGIKQIVVGFRDDEGYVHRIQVSPVVVNDLPRKGQWQGNICFNFLATVLGKVKTLLENENSSEPSCTITYDPTKRSVTFEKNLVEDFFNTDFRHHFSLEPPPP
ncbi:unnamed protein product, partial [Mesorhabditis belari]|uniref:Decapping nuclease n=1 Tax=Mesorhabditis belari TaxID=2138241 RepID=A0AAF3EJZ7_9BILA